jgi:hypothetical protein
MKVTASLIMSLITVFAISGCMGEEYSNMQARCLTYCQEGKFSKIDSACFEGCVRNSATLVTTFQKCAEK